MFDPARARRHGVEGREARGTVGDALFQIATYALQMSRADHCQYALRPARGDVLQMRRHILIALVDQR